MTPEERIVLALGKMPWLPAATHRRVSVRDFSIEDVAGVLEDMAAFLPSVVEQYGATERELDQIKSDVEAMRRLFGLGS